MKPTSVNLKYPLIRFLGKRTFNAPVDHTPKPHPMSPTNKLPSSFSKPAPAASFSSSSSAGLKYTPPGPGEYASISELPARFRFKPIVETEIETVNGGGAGDVIHQL